MSKVILLVALAAAAHVHAVEHDAAGNVITGAAVRFVSSDETLFTVTPNETDPMAADLCGLREGSGVLSVYDAHSDALHVSYDVHVTPAVAVALELDDDAGEDTGTGLATSSDFADDAPAAALSSAEAETSADLERAQHDADQAPTPTEAPAAAESSSDTGSSDSSSDTGSSDSSSDSGSTSD